MAAEMPGAFAWPAESGRASMRPRRMAAEMPEGKQFVDAVVMASMRPRRMAAEMVVGQRRGDRHGLGFNEAAANGRGNSAGRTASGRAETRLQ